MYQKIYHGPFEVILKTLKIIDQRQEEGRPRNG